MNSNNQSVGLSSHPNYERVVVVYHAISLVTVKLTGAFIGTPSTRYTQAATKYGGASWLWVVINFAATLGRI